MVAASVGRFCLGDVEVAAEGAAGEVDLGRVFFVGATFECMSELRVEPDRDDFWGPVPSRGRPRMVAGW